MIPNDQISYLNQAKDKLPRKHHQRDCLPPAGGAVETGTPNTGTVVRFRFSK